MWKIDLILFQKLEGRKSQLLDEVKSIASPDRAYKNYKEKLRTINPPCVPFVGKLLYISNMKEPTCTRVVLCRCMLVCVPSNFMECSHYAVSVCTV